MQCKLQWETVGTIYLTRTIAEPWVVGRRQTSGVAVNEAKEMTSVPIFERRLVEAWPESAWADVNVLLAVSGGADSVALLRAMVACKQRIGGSGQLYVAHVNHRLRGRAADEDQAWVVALCEALGTPVKTAGEDVSSRAREEGDGWEAAARNARYDFFRGTAEQLGARYVATAHTADDQIETVLHRIVRGTGLSGLAGIPMHRPLSPTVTVVRPMLRVYRNEVLDYLRAISQGFRIDATNVDSTYLRNRTRHDLLPKLRAAFNPAVDQALLRLAEQARQFDDYLHATIPGLADQCISVERSADGSKTTGVSEAKPDCLVVQVDKLLAQPNLAMCEILRYGWQLAGWPLQAMGYEQWQQLVDLLQSDDPPSAITLPGNVRAERHGERLTLTR